jgi:hypothetical protein
MAYRKFHDRTVATVATVAKGTGQNQKPGSNEINSLGSGSLSHSAPGTSPDFQKSRGTLATMATTATNGVGGPGPVQRNTSKSQTSTERPQAAHRAAPGNGRAASEDSHLCDHCGQPGAELWTIDDGRTVYLHDQCQYPWADENLDLFTGDRNGQGA